MTDRPDTDLTIAAIGTSVTWSTGNHYEHKFPNLVHRDLNGGYPIEEKYLHYNPGPNEDVSEPRYPYDPEKDADYPQPSYYKKTVENNSTAEEHPRGPHIPPSQYRARGGAIIGLDWPAKVEIGDTDADAGCDDIQYNDAGGYLTNHQGGEYDGKLDGLGEYGSIDSSFADLFVDSRLDRSKWLLMRDIGWSWPTIVDQIEQFESGGANWGAPADVPIADIPDPFDYELPKSPPPPEDVDLVLLDGGTNDMQLGWINDPTKAGRSDLQEAAELYLYENMTGNDGLLKRARRTFPNAILVLVGYPVWTSNRSDYDRVKDFLKTQSILGGLPSVPEQAIDNPLNFSHFQAHYLRRAVAEMAREDDGPGIIFAPPGWGVINSMMADWPWSFGIKFSDFPTVRSIDDTWKEREQVCKAEAAWEGRNATDACENEVEMVTCRAAAIGHPNNEGCRQYADTIVRRYKEYVHLGVGATSDEFDSRTDSLRRSLERYGIGPNGTGLRDSLSDPDASVRWMLSHRVVDSIKARLVTRGIGNTAAGAKKGRPYLKVYPGREGTGELFPLDTESRDYAPGSDDVFFIDPMMRRRLTGPVGNVDASEIGAKTGRTEPNKQTVHPPGHWSDRRLRLGDIEHMSIVLEGVDPTDGWALDDVEYEINGAISGERDLGSDFDQKDFRARTRATEFQVASFNHVEGVSASDFILGANPTDFDGSLGSVAEVDVDLTVTSTTNRRIPSVVIQCGMRVNGNGRDWQTLYLGDFAPNEKQTETVTLQAQHDPALQTGEIEIDLGVFVGDTNNWFSTTTSRSDLS